METLIPQLKSLNNDLKEAEIAGILFLLLNEPELTNSDLVRKTGLPKETLRRFKSTIGTMLEDTDEDQIVLKKESRGVLSKIELSPFSWRVLDLHDPAISAKIEEIRSKHSLQPKREFDQFFATPKTTSAKLEIMKLKDQIHNKKIALLGDDDLLSVALGSSKENYSKIDVFEIDQNLITALKKISAEENLKETNYIQYDARKLPLQQFEGRYDVVVTDPPYTASGVTLFLNRSIQFIGNKEGAYIFLYFGNSFKSPEKFIKIQEIVNKFGLVIEDKIDKFAQYYGAESIGSVSSLYILRTTKSTKPIDDSILPRIIYTFENTKEEKFPYVDHVVVKLLDVPSVIVKSKTKLTAILGNFCNKHHLKVVDTVVTDFKGGGMTITYVLANSNLVLHTWPEFGAVHMDLITCAPIYRKDLLINNLGELFKTDKIEFLDVQ